jgi:hypothetical protein
VLLTSGHSEQRLSHKYQEGKKKAFSYEYSGAYKFKESLLIKTQMGVIFPHMTIGAVAFVFLMALD